MIHPGLVSITFRKLSPQEIVTLVADAGLAGIEWGGDIHVPHGDDARAAEVRRMTADAGLAVAAYGSYYRVGEENDFAFEQVLDTAVALGAPTVRVWAGRKGSDDADADYRRGVVAEAQRLADLAAPAGLTLSFEFHRKTLTDTNASALRLYEEIGHPSVRAYWQPSMDMEPAERLEGLRGLLPVLSNLHVYHWAHGTERRPLAEGAAEWAQYLSAAKESGRDHYALIEFVKDDRPAAFLADAAALRQWLEA